MKRFDTNSAQIQRNDDGSLSAVPVITRVGIFLYHKADGSTVRELRHPDEVFKTDSLNTAKMIPVTNCHPKEFVTPENAKDLSVGYTGEDVKHDDTLVTVPIKVQTFDGIDAIERGRLELSLGYSCDMVNESGVWNGEHYDAKQINIKYNHLAIVDEARAGHVASMRLDGNDNQLIIGDTINKNDGGDMATFRIDKADYEIPVQVESHIDKLDAKITTVSGELTAKQGELDTLQAKLDSAEDENKQLKADASDENIQLRVDARVALVESAKTVCGDAIKNDMSDEAIKTAVIAKVFPEAKLDGKSSDYIQARYDTALEVKKTNSVTKQSIQMQTKNDGNEYVSRADSMKMGTYTPNTEKK